MKTYQNPVMEMMIVSDEDILTASILSSAVSGGEMGAINFGTLWS